MRRIAFLPLALVAATACQDQPTAPQLAAPDDAAPAAWKERGSAPVTIAGEERVLGYTEGEVYRYHNRPEPDLGGDRVVWRYRENAYHGDVTVFQTRLSTGTTTQLAQVPFYALPHTSGRYTTWHDGQNGLVVLDNLTGRQRRIEGSWPYAHAMDAAGHRLAYIDHNHDAPKVIVYDIRNGESRTIAESPPGTPSAIVDLAFDGRYVAWIAETHEGEWGQGMMVHDLATGQQHMAVPFQPGRMTGPSIDRGRIVFSMDAGDRHSVFLYDAAARTTRRISDAPGRQQKPEISGDLIVWEDTRDGYTEVYVSNFDVYLYDLATGVETPLVRSPAWSSDPQIDGNRVVWTERRNNRWEVLLVELTARRQGPGGWKVPPRR